ncbi:MAG: transcription termination factor NusA [Candidatus Glassbacteria bacterium]
MNFNVMDIFNELVKEKNLDRATIHSMVEAGLTAAARKKYGAQANVIVRIEEMGNSISIFLKKQVVDEVLDGVLEISVKEAKAYKSKPVCGDEIEIPIDFADFSRNAILAAKQVVIQRIREAERERVLREYSGKVGEIISGSIQQIERGNFIIFVDKATEAIIPQREQVKREHYRQGDPIRACLIEVLDTSKGPQLILSRAHPDFVKALFKLEVPEISQGIVEIKGTSREPGSRTKIAVQSHDMNVDAVGACVGLKGSRVQAIVSELGGERIDIVPFSEDPNIFVRRALSPSSVSRTIPEENENKMTVIVAEDQLSLAIGKSGQNVRLASKLTGWDIDLLTAKEYDEREAKKEEGELISLEDYELTRIPGIGDKTALQLAGAGYKTLADLLNANESDLLEVPGIGKKTATKLIAIITNLSDELAIEEEVEEEVEGESLEGVGEGVGEGIEEEAEEKITGEIEQEGGEVEVEVTDTDSRDEPVTEKEEDRGTGEAV